MRKLMLLVAIVLLIAVGGLAVIAFNFDSYLNDNRDWIAEQAEATLGRSVSFGEARISLQGGLSVRVADLRIGDDPAFASDPFVSADAIDLRVSIMPALFGNIEIGRIVLQSPSITVIKTARGMSTDSLGGDSQPSSKAEQGESAPDSEVPEFLVSMIDIRNGTLRYVDKTAKPAAEQTIGRLDLRASNVSLSGPVGLDLKAAILDSDQQNIRIVAEVIDPENPTATFTVTSNRISLAPDGADEFRDLELKGKLDASKGAPQIDATLKSPKGSVGGATYADLAVAFNLRDQVATIERLSARAFDGEIEVSGRYDLRNASRPSFDLRSKLSGMRVEQLASSNSAKSDGSIQGELGAQLDLVGSGADWDQIKQTLRGKGGLQLVEGTLKDVNLADSSLQAVTGVPGLSNLLPPQLRNDYPQVFGVGDTVFEKMDAKIDVRDGFAYLRDFRLAARDYAITGNGRCSLDKRLDMTTVMAFSEALSERLVESAGPMQYLRSPTGRVEIPVKLIGTLPEVKTVPDVGYIAKAASRQAVGKLLTDALGGSDDESDASPTPTTESAAKDLLNKGLGGLFGK